MQIGKLYPDNFMTSLTLSRACEYLGPYDAQCTADNPVTNYKRSGAGAKAAKEEQP